MFRAAFPLEEAKSVDLFMNRVCKYVRRIDYSHFRQFEKPLERCALEEYISIKRKYNVSCLNLFI